MAKVQDCDIVVNEFELQWRCYARFRSNTLGKGMNSLIPYPWIKKLLFFYNDDFGIK